MEFRNKTQNKKVWSMVATGIVILAVVIAAIAILSGFFKNEETYISTKTTDAKVGALSCKASQPVDPFFVSNTVLNNDHELKVTYSGGGIDKINYTYNGEYASNDAANNARSLLHADYNIYMGENAESLYPTFSVVENKLKISLYTEYRKLNTKNAILFFINADEYQGLGDYSVDDLRNLYENKGFSCEMSE